MIAMKIITYSCLLFSGLTKSKFKYYRKRYKLNNLVEIHHLIPRQHKNHPVILNCKYNIEDGYNFQFLPTKLGSSKLNLHNKRPIHEKGHYKYNLFIKDYLDYLYLSDNYSYQDLIELNKFLRKNMRDIQIPWN